MAPSNKCFGILPFDKKKPIVEIFLRIVKPLVESHTGLKYEDARDYYESSTIKMDTIHRMIEEARLVIADISEKNPNVFLEIGIAYSLKKPIVFLCSENSWEDNDLWHEKLPFDLKGRELLKYKDANELKIQLGKFIQDSLYKTNTKLVSWSTDNARNDNARIDLKSNADINISEGGSTWCNVPVNNNFTISYHVNITKATEPIVKPDIRLNISPNPNGFPRIINIFPWEFISEKPDYYECHINFCEANNTKPERIRQVPVGSIKSSPDDFDIFFSFCWPHLVFESTFFKEEITRLIVPLSDFRNRGFPLHFNQYIGFSAINCEATISNINIKEVFI